MPGNSKEELANAVDEAEWGWLRAHLERGGLILVAPDLELQDVGMAIVTDDTATVSRWIEAGKLVKPSLLQIEEWDSDRSRTFLTLIVSPYVLIRENR